MYINVSDARFDLIFPTRILLLLTKTFRILAAFPPRSEKGPTADSTPIPQWSKPMRNVETSQIDVADWIKSLLPSELWERYCHLTYAQMTRIPELANDAEYLREADRNWLRTRRMKLQ